MTPNQAHTFTQTLTQSDPETRSSGHSWYTTNYSKYEDEMILTLCDFEIDRLESVIKSDVLIEPEELQKRVGLQGMNLYRMMEELKRHNWYYWKRGPLKYRWVCSRDPDLEWSGEMAHRYYFSQ